MISKPVLFSSWIALLSACLLIGFTPGAGAINTMNNALRVGFHRALWGILGQQAALLIQLAIVAAGLGLVIANSPTAFAVIRYCGAAYLVYLGIGQIRAGRDDDPATTDFKAGPATPWSMFTRGVWVNLLNPKAIVFLLAFIPGFVRPERDLLVQYGIIAVTIVTVDVVVMWLFFATLGKSFARFAATDRGRRGLGWLFGLLFIAVGVMLAVL
ncbi:MAG: LysE family transporter [Gordonia sp. (in: high G+C Gram-positive bacteria)]|uniref:LysE family translocator n=1 Tax=Gordonia sp. (in: high G+C Gram-positive bacteria) TaxID=84139 RepID=UPI0039E68BB1